MALTFTKHEKISLKRHMQFDEKWLQDRIAEDPSILGLGELELRAVEKIQPKAGRLDLLFKDPETDRRYEVELMLGTVDASHIIRTLEYWDIERKRYPQYDHCAVIVAEEITSRFLNVIGLFNSAIPIIAIQLNALRVGDSILLNFTKVLDEIILGDDEDEPREEPADRAYWEKKASPESLAVLDACMKTLREIEPGCEPKYNKYEVGLLINGHTDNFVVFSPKKKFLGIAARVPDSEAWRERFDGVSLVLNQAKAGKRLRFTTTAAALQENHEMVKEIFAAARQGEENGD
ncbi:MAG: hypothetical protein GX621_15495 [Pirellulaceae bacterium]|nr:hypothetical protein [Pirellulaceae bacterium]